MSQVNSLVKSSHLVLLEPSDRRIWTFPMASAEGVRGYDGGGDSGEAGEGCPNGGSK